MQDAAHRIHRKRPLKHAIGGGTEVGAIAAHHDRHRNPANGLPTALIRADGTTMRAIVSVGRAIRLRITARKAYQEDFMLEI